jgi:hypothetical protein
LEFPGVSVDHPLEVLRLLLGTAAHVARDLMRDPLLERLVKIFADMPAGDREVVVGALEREVRTRLVSQQVADSLTHVELRPNPNAQLYFRVIDPEQEPVQEQESQIEMVAFLRAAHNLQRGIDALDPTWRNLVREALRHLDRPGLESLLRFNGAMKELLDEVMSQPSPAVTPDPPRQEPERPPVPKGARSRGS